MNKKSVIKIAGAALAAGVVVSVFINRKRNKSQYEVNAKPAYASYNRHDYHK